MKLSLKIAHANTTTSTLNINGLGAKTIKYTTGSNIIANDLIVGMLAQFEYDGTNFQLLNPATQSSGGILPVSKGGTGVSSVTTSPTATSWAGWDANSNLSANNNLVGYATTATAAGTTTLTVASKNTQFFTGATTQTVVLPVTSTLVLGHKFLIQNRSSAVVTVQSSGANTIKAMEANSQLSVTCILTSGTSAASWDYSYSVVQGALPVDDGGTGVSSTTAYAVLCGGTDSTGALQSIASVGALNNLMASNGAGALPTFKSRATLGLITSVVKQVFTASGTYTPTAGMVFCDIEMVGGGGGGGGAAGGTGTSAAGGGGGSGAYSRILATAATIGASQTVTIGAGGTLGASGNNNGGAGSATSVGSICTANGGAGGSGAAASAVSQVGGLGGQGGSAGTGDISIPGSAGGTGSAYGSTTQGLSGIGAPSFYSGSPTQVFGISGGTIGAPTAPANSGAGGSGGASGNASGTAGGAGGSGIVHIIEYLSV